MYNLEELIDYYNNKYFKKISELSELSEKDLYTSLSYNKNVTLKLINKYQDKTWYWGWNGISSNPNSI